MGKKIFCRCGSDIFEIYQNVWAKTIVQNEHIEVVCKKCGLGRTLIKEGGHWTPTNKHNFHGEELP